MIQKFLNHFKRDKNIILFIVLIIMLIGLVIWVSNRSLKRIEEHIPKFGSMNAEHNNQIDAPERMESQLN